jgi:hypothetical protein
MGALQPHPPAAQGLRKEIDQMVQTQVERVMNNLNIIAAKILKWCAIWQKKPALKTPHWQSDSLSLRRNFPALSPFIS